METADPSSNVSRPMPIWLSIPIILICLFCSGWIIHWYVMTDPISHQSTILGDPVAQTNWQLPGGRFRGAPNNNARRLVRDRGNGDWEIRTELARAEAKVVSGKLTIPLLTYLAYEFVPAEVKTTIYAARGIVNDTARVSALKLSPQQVKQLRQLSLTINMAVTPANRDALNAVLQNYIAAKPAERTTLEPRVLQALDDVAGKSAAPTRQLATDRARQINAIMTPEMWKLNTAMGGGK